MASPRLLYLFAFAVWVCQSAEPHLDSEVVSLHGDHHHHKKSVSFSYDHSPSKASDLVQPPTQHHQRHAQDLIQMGQLLAGIANHDSTGQAVESLTSALQTKVLMDTLKPDNVGSFVDHPVDASSLGENVDKVDKGGKAHFNSLMNAKKKNMAAITRYLMDRKMQGRPLTAAEDQQLQKFYYNRASTILKKIVLLKKGQSPPGFGNKKHQEKLVHPEVDDESSQVAADETDQLNYDAKVAKDNTAFDDRAARKIKRKIKADDAEREAENREEMDQLNFDKKVARANEHYNDQLLSQVKHEAQRAAHVSMLARKAAKALNAGLKKQNSMSKIEAELQAQKRQAQKAVERFASEQKDAEQKVEDAEAAKAKADAEASKAAAMLAAAEKQAAVSAKREDARQAPGLPHIPAAERISNMVQYLRTALSHHNSISKEDLKIMQSFFLQHGGQLLSKLAQIEPDATWSDKHVMSTEQWAMDHGRPDQLSQEWGGKKVKKETLLRDVVGNELTRHESRNTLKRPDTQQAVQGLFGMASKLPLKFAPDHSEKMVEEPELGESMDSDDEAPTKKAFSSMMGIN